MSAVRVEMNLSFREFCDLAVGIAGAGADGGIEGNDATYIADQNAQQIEAMRYEIASLKAEIEGYDEDRRLIEAELAQERLRITELTGELAESERFASDLRAMLDDRDAAIEKVNREQPPTKIKTKRDNTPASTASKEPCASEEAPPQSPDPSPAYVTVAEALADRAPTIEPGIEPDKINMRLVVMP